MKRQAIFLFAAMFLAGCSAAAPYVKPVAPLPSVPGMYHRVAKGETLWRISKAYNVNIDEIARINHIVDNTRIEVGQQLFIPNALKIRPQPIRYTNEDFIWPLKGRVILGFGQTSNHMVNKGINIQPYAKSDVLASRSGRVVFYSDSFSVFGKTIVLEHSDGFSTVYARNSEVFIKTGDTVQKGALIAKAGSAGRDRSTYLHFEIRKGHIPVNPFHYLP